MKRSDHHLIQQILDGSISQSAFAAFQQRMRGEPELAKLYAEYALLNHSLCEEFEGQKWTGGTSVKSVRVFPLILIGLAAAAVVALLMVSKKSIGQTQASQPVAKTAFSADAVWNVEGVSKTGENFVSMMPGAKLHLQQGQVNIVLGNSATALIEGPSTLTVVSGKTMDLAEGRGRFHVVNPGGGLKVTAPSLTAVDLGMDFGIDASPGKSSELHVMEGKVRMLPKGREPGEVLSAGEAARVSDAGQIERFSADGKRFLKELSSFETVVGGPFVKANWRIQYGNPAISEGGMDGENYSALMWLPKPEPADGKSVLLATLEVGRPAAGEFHTDGWAGMSFFSKGAEVLFFGDAFGAGRTWSLDVKQRIPVIMPTAPVLGPRTVTLCYHKKTGDVTLHEGGIPLGAEFCRGKLAAGLEFDEIRLGASSGAALNVRSLTIRTGGGIK
ncbi:MAG: hypothetical protein ABI162_15810 [Luteolibacter sp.]